MPSEPIRVIVVIVVHPREVLPLFCRRRCSISSTTKSALPVSGKTFVHLLSGRD